MKKRVATEAGGGSGSASRVVGYVRISSAREWDGPSAESQARSITQWCEANGFHLLATLQDDHDGLDEYRAGLITALRMVERGEVAAVVVHRVDRLSRRLPGLVAIVDRLTESDAALLTVAERFDSGSVTGRLMMSAFGIAAALEAPVAGGGNTDAAECCFADGRCQPDADGLVQ